MRLLAAEREKFFRLDILWSSSVRSEGEIYAFFQ